MYEIKNEKFGSIFIDDLNELPEPDRIKIYDNGKRYVSYISMEVVEYASKLRGVTIEDTYKLIVCKIRNTTDIFQLLYALTVVECEFIGKLNETYQYTMDNNFFDDETLEAIKKATDEGDLTDDFLLSNDFINNFGDYYVIMSE